MAFLRKGNVAEAKDELQEGVRVAPNVPQLLNSLAQLNLSVGESTVAQEYAERSVRLNSSDAAGRVLLGRALAQQNHLKPAEEQLRLAQQLSPKDPTVHSSLAFLYERAGKWKEADQELESALTMDPQFSPALGQIADLWVARKEPDQAIARVRKHLAIHPGDANAHVVLGSLFVAQKQYDAAQPELERALQLSPNLLQAHLQLGRLLQSRGEIDAAIERFEKAATLQPKFAPLRTLIGNLYLEKGNLEQARKSYEQALSIDPNFPIAAGNLAWVFAEEDINLDVAVSMAQKAKQLLPDLDSISDTLAWVYYKKGNYNGAVPLLEECVEKAPDRASYRYHLGMALLAGGQKGKAKQQLEAALGLRLTGADARRAREALAQAN
jgi:tetratricopeptide (TPR) repeat protein